MPGMMFRNAVIIAALSSLAGLTVNFIRRDGLPLFAEKQYDIFVPCPEPIGEVKAAAPGTIKPDATVLIIDARPESSFKRSHFPGALNLVFDYLYPAPDPVVKSIAASKARRVIVYGDGKRPDCGHELARELAGRGIRNVTYVEGGYDELARIISK